MFRLRTRQITLTTRHINSSGMFLSKVTLPTRYDVAGTILLLYYLILLQEHGSPFTYKIRFRISRVNHRILFMTIPRCDLSRVSRLIIKISGPFY